jgi:hypothetical protein
MRPVKQTYREAVNPSKTDLPGEYPQAEPRTLVTPTYATIAPRPIMLVNIPRVATLANLHGTVICVPLKNRPPGATSCMFPLPSMLILPVEVHGPAAELAE